MNFLTLLNITMVVVLLGLFLCSRQLFIYRASLKDALLLATTPIILEKVAYIGSHRRSLELAQKHHMMYDVLWIPLFYLTFITVILLWIGMSIGTADSLFGVVVAGAVSTIITRCVTYNHCPTWLMDWMTDMMYTYNIHETEILRQRVEEIIKRANELVEQLTVDEELSSEKHQELFNLVIEQANLQVYADTITDTMNTIKLYQDTRKNN